MGAAAAPDQPLLRTRPARSLNRASIETGISIALRGLRCGTSAAKREITMATEFAHKDHARFRGTGCQGDRGADRKASFGCVSMDGGGFDGGVRHDADDGQQERQPLRRAMGTNIPHFRALQQARKATRLRPHRKRRITFAGAISGEARSPRCGALFVTQNVLAPVCERHSPPPRVSPRSFLTTRSILDSAVTTHLQPVALF